jgi:hypothetical protein
MRPVERRDHGRGAPPSTEREGQPLDHLVVRSTAQTGAGVESGRVFIALSKPNYLALRWTFRERLPDIWPGQVELLDWSRQEPRWRAIARLVARTGRYDAVVVDGSVGARGWYMDRIAAAIIRRRSDPPIVVVSDCPWKRGSWWLDRVVGGVAFRLIDGPEVTYCVPTRAETAIFPLTWGIDPGRVAWTPWPFLLSDQDLAAPVSDDGGVFAGGDSLRDYGPLLAAAVGLEAPVTIATRRRDVLRQRDLPTNVTARPVSRERYIQLMREATVVVVALAETSDRSAGESTYVNAMALGKLVVVPDRLGVREYVRDGETGIVIPGEDPGALREALEWALDPVNAERRRAMGEAARAWALEELTPDGYLLDLLRVAREASERRPSRPRGTGTRPSSRPAGSDRQEPYPS